MRSSRALLTKSSSVPEWLTSRFPVPAWGAIHHTVSKDGNNPLFQAKLANKEVFDGKSLCIHWTHFLFILFRKDRSWPTEEQLRMLVQRQLGPGTTGRGKGQSEECDAKRSINGSGLFHGLVMAAASRRCSEWSWC